jgi:hypothetical protein
MLPSVKRRGTEGTYTPRARTLIPHTYMHADTLTPTHAPLYTHVCIFTLAVCLSFFFCMFIADTLRPSPPLQNDDAPNALTHTHTHPRSRPAIHAHTWYVAFHSFFNVTLAPPPPWPHTFSCATTMHETHPRTPTCARPPTHIRPHAHMHAHPHTTSAFFHVRC